MPNWCENTLTITGDTKQLDDFLDKAIKKTEYGKVLDLQALYPCPDELLKQSSPNVQLDTETPKDYKKRIGFLKNEYDVDNWYDWQVNKWGTKWGDCEIFSYDKTDNEATIFFSSAWAPPDRWLRKVAKDFTELYFFLEFLESGIGFCGTLVGDSKGMTMRHGYIIATDEEGEEVEWNSSMERYMYCVSGGLIDDEDFIPNLHNSLTYKQ